LPGEKIARPSYRSVVVYDKARWSLLREMRDSALSVMRPLWAEGLNPLLHGSAARGDVDRGSDVDITILSCAPSYRVEVPLRERFAVCARRIVQATPSSAPKAYLILDPDERVVASFPLLRLSRVEEEFYRFGGIVDMEQLERGARVPGVDKRLMLIEPIEGGHVESSIIGRESEVAKVLGISVMTVRERVRVLSRRESVGRTGVFVNYELREGESFEEGLVSIARNSWQVRKLIRERSG